MATYIGQELTSNIGGEFRVDTPEQRKNAKASLGLFRRVSIANSTPEISGRTATFILNESVLDPSQHCYILQIGRSSYIRAQMTVLATYNNNQNISYNYENNDEPVWVRANLTRTSPTQLTLTLYQLGTGTVRFNSAAHSFQLMILDVTE